MDRKMLDAALAYAARGWYVFPILPNEKVPFTGTRGHMDATTDPVKITAWWTKNPNANIGWHPGMSGHVVLDWDIKGGAVKYDHAAVVAKMGAIPETQLWARTPNGGDHDIYETLKPIQSRNGTDGEWNQGLDIKSTGGYILLAPSHVDDGKTKGSYEWGETAAHGGATPATATEEMCAACSSVVDRHENAQTWLIEPDLAENLADCALYLSGEHPKYDCAIAVEHHGGDQCAYDTAAMCHSFGVSEEAAHELMFKFWSPRCQPDWIGWEEYIQAKIRHAYSYCTNPPGNVTPAYRVAVTASLFQPVTHTVDGVEIKRNPGGYRWMTADMVKELPPPVYLLDDCLVKGTYALMYGAPGSYKSFTALDMALTIATGAGPVWKPSEQGAVVYIAGEGVSGLGKRMKSWLSKHGGDASSFYAVDPVPTVAALLKDGNIDALFEDMGILDASHEVKLVVIDTVSRSLAGVNENDAAIASTFTQLVAAIQQRYGAAVLAVHHSGSGKETKARGSTVFEADADTVLQAQDIGGLAASLTMTKQKDGEAWKAPKVLQLSSVLDSLAITQLSSRTPKHGDSAKHEEQRTKGVETRRRFREAFEKATHNISGGKKYNRAALAEYIAGLTIKGVDGEQEPLGIKTKYISDTLLREVIENEKEAWSDLKKYWDGAQKQWIFRG